MTLLTMQRCALHSLSSPSPSHKGRGRRRMGLRLSGSSGNSVAGKDGIPFGPLLLLPVRSGLIPSKLFTKIWGRPQTDENQNGQALLTQPAADLPPLSLHPALPSAAVCLPREIAVPVCCTCSPNYSLRKDEMNAEQCNFNENRPEFLWKPIWLK